MKSLDSLRVDHCPHFALRALHGAVMALVLVLLACLLHYWSLEIEVGRTGEQCPYFTQLSICSIWHWRATMVGVYSNEEKNEF